MIEASEHVVVMLTVGKADNGKHATMAFSCGLSSLAIGRPTAIFLTSDGAVWGYRSSATGISVQGFPPLAELIDSYLASGGRIILCSVCHRTCSVGGPADTSIIETLPEIEIGGFATVLDLAIGGTTITF